MEKLDLLVWWEKKNQQKYSEILQVVNISVTSYSNCAPILFLNL